MRAPQAAPIPRQMGFEQLAKLSDLWEEVTKCGSMHLIEMLLDMSKVCYPLVTQGAVMPHFLEQGRHREPELPMMQSPDKSSTKD